MRIFTWRQRFIVVFVNLASIALFVGLGFLADRSFGTKPWFAVAGFLISFFVGQFVLAKWLTREYHQRSK